MLLEFLSSLLQFFLICEQIIFVCYGLVMLYFFIIT